MECLEGVGPKVVEISAKADPEMTKVEYNTDHGALTTQAFSTDESGLQQEVLHLKLPQGHFTNFKSDGYITGPGTH
ncbi:hypothetical protein GCM10025857_15910 [Alicyclobacillus contaminans]|nr:hypothetical protein GCM10025857_15910 [Alicyclobacillus contaminans]